MDRSDEASFHVRDRRAKAVFFNSIRLACGLFKAQLKSASQLGRGLSRESNGRYSVDRASSLSQQVDHTGDQARRLAGSSGGLDEHILIELTRDQIALGLIRRGRSVIVRLARRVIRSPGHCANSGKARGSRLSMRIACGYLQMPLPPHHHKSD